MTRTLALAFVLAVSHPVAAAEPAELPVAVQGVEPVPEDAILPPVSPVETVASPAPVDVEAVAEDAVESVSLIVQAFRDGNFAMAAGLLLIVIVALLRRLWLDAISEESKGYPLLVSLLAGLGVVGSGLAAGVPILTALEQAGWAALAAMGIYDLGGALAWLVSLVQSKEE